ncbi:MAG: T9SS type A sorting domain-containing protein [Candidatus Kapabacteria bacterium]|nr:T9SS type A sorting domain-containing protein [Ignavibacteriota bacterium]MCW5884926.1 T9SS type A sorting domain-containing protein [Candidatus Kapabacteria bacterium]
MKKYFIFYILIIYALSIRNTQAIESGTIDTVYYYYQGEGDPAFENNPYFPDNIFGLPSRNATRTLPESSPAEIEAIGTGGEIIVGFKGKVLRNGQGADFIIFENAFINQVTGGIFAEPGLVSVSQDGIRFIEFPFDSQTLEGLAGLSPTRGDKDPFNPEISGGDAFDLEVLKLDYIKYIKIKDTTNIIKSLPQGHKYKNPDFLLNGFDLDAVVGLYLEDEQAVSVNEKTQKFKIITNSNFTEIIYPGIINNICIFNILGERIDVLIRNRQFIDISNLSCGVYFIEISTDNETLFDKFVKF